MNDIHEMTRASASVSPCRGISPAPGYRRAKYHSVAATSVNGRPSITRVGTLPSALIARYSGERWAFWYSRVGLASNATPTSCSAMCVAIVLEPGEKYNVSMVPAPRDALARPCTNLGDLAISRRQFDAQPSCWPVISITALATPYGQSGARLGGRLARRAF